MQVLRQTTKDASRKLCGNCEASHDRCNYGARIRQIHIDKTVPPIRTHAEHRRLTQVLLELDEREDLSPKEENLAEMLTLVIEDYEEKRYPMPQVSPNDSLKALMEERGLKHKDIWPVLGNKGTATEVLNGRRSISKAQARRLAEFLRVPIELFV
jgi:HTH-type transcriptional regulator/antitoxin HigA